MLDKVVEASALVCYRLWHWHGLGGDQKTSPMITNFTNSYLYVYLPVDGWLNAWAHTCAALDPLPRAVTAS
jgi:hypothetical protein